MSSKHATTEIGFIGGGNMARAIVRGLLQAGHPAACISVADPSDASQAAMQQLDAAISLTTDNAMVAARAEVLVLAVKPQMMAEVAAALGQVSRPAGQVIVSVAAGITLATLQEWFGATALVRVMPNQPALLGAGMSGLCASPETGAAEKELANYVMAATGEAVWFEDESLLDAVTAISGSGPAYFYLVMEIMQEAAREFGFDDAVARLLVTQTAAGAAKVAVDSNEDLATLRAQVTSPGGTTAAALTVLEDAGIRDMFRQALDAAHRRSRELGRKQA